MFPWIPVVSKMLYIMCCHAYTIGLSNPYVEVKVGMEIMYRSRVIKHTLNPEWLEHVSLNMPSADEVITMVTIL